MCAAGAAAAAWGSCRAARAEGPAAPGGDGGGGGAPGLRSGGEAQRRVRRARPAAELCLRAAWSRSSCGSGLVVFKSGGIKVGPGQCPAGRAGGGWRRGVPSRPGSAGPSSPRGAVRGAFAEDKICVFEVNKSFIEPGRSAVRPWVLSLPVLSVAVTNSRCLGKVCFI